MLDGDDAARAASRDERATVVADLVAMLLIAGYVLLAVLAVRAGVFMRRH